MKSVGQGVHEARIDYGRGYRIYFGNDGARLVVLLLCGDKKMQSEDIATAKALWTEYGTWKAALSQREGQPKPAPLLRPTDNEAV